MCWRLFQSIFFISALLVLAGCDGGIRGSNGPASQSVAGRVYDAASGKGLVNEIFVESSFGRFATVSEPDGSFFISADLSQDEPIVVGVIAQNGSEYFETFPQSLTGLLEVSIEQDAKGDFSISENINPKSQIESDPIKEDQEVSEEPSFETGEELKTKKKQKEEPKNNEGIPQTEALTLTASLNLENLSAEKSDEYSSVVVEVYSDREQVATFKVVAGESSTVKFRAPAGEFFVQIVTLLGTGIDYYLGEINPGTELSIAPNNQGMTIRHGHRIGNRENINQEKPSNDESNVFEDNITRNDEIVLDEPVRKFSDSKDAISPSRESRDSKRS